jgi:hypothetical protein
MSSKLTLSVDEKVARQAKRYARRKGTSVSRMVEGFLEAVTDPRAEPKPPPVLTRLRGSLRGKGTAEHRRYLERKYR